MHPMRSGAFVLTYHLIYYGQEVIVLNGYESEPTLAINMETIAPTTTKI
jgi:hypothetical protein